MATILILVFLDIEVITEVPLLPQPIIPTCIAELALEPKTVAGLKMVMAEIAAAPLRKDLLSMFIMV